MIQRMCGICLENSQNFIQVDARELICIRELQKLDFLFTIVIFFMVLCSYSVVECVTWTSKPKVAGSISTVWSGRFFSLPGVDMHSE